MAFVGTIQALAIAWTNTESQLVITERIVRLKNVLTIVAMSTANFQSENASKTSRAHTVNALKKINEAVMIAPRFSA